MYSISAQAFDDHVQAFLLVYPPTKTFAQTQFNLWPTHSSFETTSVPYWFYFIPLSIPSIIRRGPNEFLNFPFRHCQYQILVPVLRGRLFHSCPTWISGPHRAWGMFFIFLVIHDQQKQCITMSVWKTPLNWNYYGNMLNRLICLLPKHNYSIIISNGIKMSPNISNSSNSFEILLVGFKIIWIEYNFNLF